MARGVLGTSGQSGRLNEMAFDPVLRIWVPAGSPGAVPVPELRGALMSDAAILSWAAEDFGHVVRHRPRAVLRPGEVADVAAIVAFAGRAGLSVAARGAGHSTYGQAQATGGIVIDMTGLNRVGAVRGGRVEVQAGALWSDVLDAGLRTGHTPPVLIDYLHTTVGGTLAVGGVGGTSHQHGFQVDGVEELDVVTGRGRLVTCSAERNRRLFDAVRAGLGQCGIVTGAILRMIPAPARARRYLLGYPDLAGYLADQRRLAQQQRFDYLEGQILPGKTDKTGEAGESGEPDGWQYLLEVACYYTPPAEPSDAALLDGLGHDRAEITDLSYREFAHRMAPGEAMLRASGEWLQPHAWLNVFLPDAVTEQVVATGLAELTAADLGRSGLVLLYPVRPARLHAPLTRVPDAELAWLFALLRTASADDPTAGAAMIEANRVGYDRALAHGGTGYPVNTLPMSRADWWAHFGPRWPELLAATEEFDPDGVLTPGQAVRAGTQPRPPGPGVPFWPDLGFPL